MFKKNVMKVLKIFFVVLSLLSFVFAQRGKFGFQDEQEQMLQERSEKSLLEERVKNIFERDALEGWIESSEYIVGAGDILSINIVGSVNHYFEVIVSCEGLINIPGHCTVNVKDATLDEAKEVIIRELRNFYKNADIEVTLINIRPVRVYVLGEVEVPGACIVKPTDRIFDAISQCGGTKRLAVLEEIKVLRDNDTITVDGNDYYLNGNIESNPKIEDGDIIFVPKSELIKQTVTVYGGVEKQGLYPVSNGQKLSDFLYKNLDFRVDVEFGTIVVSRDTDNEKKTYKFDMSSKSGSYSIDEFILEGGDVIEIGILSKVYVQGEVNIPGSYSYISGFKAIDYVGLAGGNTKFGNPEKIQIIHSDGTRSGGLYKDIKRGDVIIVPRSLSATLVGELSTLEIISSLASVVLTIVLLGR